MVQLTTHPPLWCALHLALGEHEACPGSTCGLWHHEACIVDSLAPEVRCSPALSRHLLDLRDALERTAGEESALRARSDFFRRLNAEQAAEA